MISTTTIGTKEEPYPILKNIWEFFSEKATKTVFVSVGTGNTCVPDLDIAETLGCPLLKLDTPENTKKWNEVKEVLKNRKFNDEFQEFAKPATRKWVLQKNLVIKEGIPSFHAGTIQTQSGTIPTLDWIQVLQEHCSSLQIPEDQVRLDILKLDLCPFETEVLTSLWNCGLRPSLLSIHWCSSPDSDIGTLNTAAQLQMIGYSLVGKEGNRFLYYYTDINYYETCSWETLSKNTENPFIANLLKSIYPGTEKNIVQFPVQK